MHDILTGTLADGRARGCSQDNLRSSGGNGYFYCFAAN